MPALIITHKVTDFNTWLKAYEEHAPVRESAGVTSSVVCQNVDDPHEVTVYMQVQDLSRAREFTTSPNLAKAMEAAGVASRPDFRFFESTQTYPH